MDEQAIVEWVRRNVSLPYEYSRGQWVDNPALDAIPICAVRRNGGPAPVANVRRLRFQLYLLGPRDRRDYAQALMQDADALVLAGMAGDTPECASNIHAVGEAVGPGFTTENRAWVQISFEVIL